MNSPAIIQALTWVRTAWREPMLVCLGVSGAVHAGVVAYAMTREPLREQVHNAGGTVAVEVVVIEGPEQHPGTQSGEDRERAAAPSAAASTGLAPPQVDEAQQAPQTAPMDPMAAAATTPVDQSSATDLPDSVPHREVTRAEQPPAARLVAEPQPGREAVAASMTPAPAPVPAPPPAGVQPEPVRHTVRPAPPPPKPRPPEPMTEQQPAPAVTAPDEDPTNSQATARSSAAQSDTPRPLAEKGEDSAPLANAGGTRGAAPIGDNPKPAYPFGARRRGEQGRVVLRVMVMPSGDASTVDVAESSGHGRLDKAALETVRHWRFVPARRGGVPVAAEVTVPIRFQLR